MKIGAGFTNSNAIYEHEAQSEIDDNLPVIDGSMRVTFR